MAQTATIQMSRPAAHQPWGFRLQGGVDFGTPLTVLRVNIGSLAETAGLKAGDQIIKINDLDVVRLRHQEVLDSIAKAGNQFQLFIARSGIWKPQVTPLAEPIKTTNGDTLLTKTSLAHHQQEEAKHAGSAHNTKAAPFPSVKEEAKNLNRQQFNSPLGLYSEEKIAETLTSQAEVLAQGVLGVNFKKNEKQYDSTNSAVFKMLQEMGNEPEVEPTEDPAELIHRAAAAHLPVRAPPPAPNSLPIVTAHRPVVIQHPIEHEEEHGPPIVHEARRSQQATPVPQQQQQQPTPAAATPALPQAQPIAALHQTAGFAPSTAGASVPFVPDAVNPSVWAPTTAVPFAPGGSPRPAGVRSVAAPQAKSFKGPEAPQATADNPRCGECDRLIVGVFVRLKDKNLHVECFKCSTCGTSLKNVGYYRLSDKLYCDVHARMVASQRPPAPNVAPVTINPGAPIPKGLLTADLAAKQLGASLSSMSLSSGAPPAGGVRIFPPAAFK